jgi:hypothetical protein
MRRMIELIRRSGVVAVGCAAFVFGPPLRSLNAASDALPFRLESVGHSANGLFTLRLHGQAGQTYTLEGSRSLANWAPLLTTNLASDTAEWTDAEAASLAQRFYRARLGSNEPTPNPLTVVALLDSNRTTTARLPVAGGTLSLTNDQGTVFTLSLPAGALREEQEISMTVVTNIVGLPLSGGLIGAVQLAPEGLQLFTNATLTIQSATPFSTNELTSFAYRGTGEDFHWFPDEISGNTVVLFLSHFSGHGSGRGTDQDRGAQNQRTPSDPSARAEQRAAQATHTARSQGRRVDEGTLSELLSEYAEAVRGRVAQGLSSDGALTLAIWHFQRWWLLVQQYRMADRFAPTAEEFLNGLGAGGKNLIDRHHQQSVQNKDPSEIKTIWTWARTFADYGLVPRSGLTPEFIRTTLVKCARFELSFDSTIELPKAYSSRLQATVIQEASPDSLIWDSPRRSMTVSGKGILEYVSFAVSLPCVVEAIGYGAELDVFTLLDLGTRAEERPCVVGLGFTIMTAVRERVVYQCPGTDPAVDEPQFWPGFFEHFHEQESQEPPNPAAAGYYEMRDWTAEQASIVGRKSYSNSLGDLIERTTLQMEHRPLP